MPRMGDLRPGSSWAQPARPTYTPYSLRCVSCNAHAPPGPGPFFLILLSLQPVGADVLMAVNACLFL